jgi:hypothetical protein
MKARLATLALPLLALAGCVDNNASVRIDSICLPPEQSDKCTFSSTCSAQFIGMTVLDLDQSSARTLWLFVQIDNQLPSNENAGLNRTNTNDAFVQEYEIAYPGTGLPTARGPIPGSAIVPANGNAVISLPAIDGATGQLITNALGAGAQVDGIAEVKLHGVYADTTKFVTGVFKVPLRVCRGCLGAIVNDIQGQVAACSNATDARFFCPQGGQSPASTKCVAP